MEFEVFDAVKLEKAKAMARFNRFQRTMKMFQFFEIIVALILISWSFTRVPHAVKFSGEFLVQFWIYLCKPHVVFVIGNAIIGALFVLCNKTEQNCSNTMVSDLYTEEITGESQPPPPVKSDPPPCAAETAAGDEFKQIVVVEKPQMQCSEISISISKATKQIEKFQRTQSEKLKLNPRRELRRSETDMRRRRFAVAGDGETVEDLSSEEFRLRIEKFIRKNQEFFKIENGRDE